MTRTIFSFVSLTSANKMLRHALRRVLQNAVEFSGSGTKLERLKKANKILVPTGIILCAQPVKIVDATVSPLQGQPDANDLSHSTILRNASSMSVNAACTLLNQTAIALAEIEDKYTKTIETLVTLLDCNLQILGNTAEEDKVWDLILETRSKVKDYKQARQELSLLMGCAEQVVTSAATAAFQAGAEYAGTAAGERLQAAKTHLVSFQKASAAAETTLTDIELKTIEVTTKFHKELKEKQAKTKETNSGPSK